MGLRPMPPAPGYKFVRVPDFVTRDNSGRITEIRCKICGRVISSVGTNVTNRIIEPDGRTIEQVETRLRYNANYAEMLIHMEDGGHHQTSGCKLCFAGRIKPEFLRELIRVDYEEMQMEAFAPSIVADLEKRTATRTVLLNPEKLGVGR